MNNNNYVIIGASGGIGRRLTLDLQAEGANLFLGYYSNQPPDQLLENAHYSQVDARSFERTIKFITDAKQRLGNLYFSDIFFVILRITSSITACTEAATSI